MNTHLQDKANLVERFLDAHLTTRLAEQIPDVGFSHLLESMRYSTLMGGKRFRPALAMMVAEALGSTSERVLPFAAAVECVHTYSLIHDDLPAMDNDDFRRGKPTNHKVYGEDTAILSGDALLTEAFRIITQSYSKDPAAALEACGELSEASGFLGMVGGQAIDMRSKKEAVTIEELERMHRMKTGALIRVAATGAAALCKATQAQKKEIRIYAENLGLAFQVADDVLDYAPEKTEAGSYPALLGLEKTKSYLAELTDCCVASLQTWSSKADPLRELAQFNLQRNH